jgi:hypothetical protein
MERKISRSIAVSNHKGATFVPEGYEVGIRVTTHVRGEDGFTVGIVANQEMTLTYGEASELLAELSAVLDEVK